MRSSSLAEVWIAGALLPYSWLSAFALAFKAGQGRLSHLMPLQALSTPYWYFWDLIVEKRSRICPNPYFALHPKQSEAVYLDSKIHGASS